MKAQSKQKNYTIKISSMQREKIIKYFNSFNWYQSKYNPTDPNYNITFTNSDYTNIQIYCWRTDITKIININIYIRSQRKTILKTTWSYIQKVNLTDCIYEHCFDVLL